MHTDGFSPSISSQCSRTLRGAGYRVHRNGFAISDSPILSAPHRRPQITTWSNKVLECGPSLLMPVEQTSAKFPIGTSTGVSHSRANLSLNEQGVV